MDKSEFYRNARNDLKGPLDGVRIIEVTTTWAGPMAGCVLADFGATVIKIEHPDGEIGRLIPPMAPNSNLSIFNETVNRNKQSVTLDLHTDPGREILLKLCATADIVIENFRPGTMSAWGLGYEEVCAVKADIVYVSISGFGQYGLYSDRIGYDPLAQNFCGWTSLNGERDGGPIKAPTFIGDDLGGLNGALGAMAALRHRDQTGEGQHIDVALIDGIMFQSDGFPTLGALGLPLEKWANQFAIATPINAYLCTDGHVFCGALLDTQWQNLTRLIGRPELADLNLADRLQRREEIDGNLRAWCAERPVAEVVDKFNELSLPAIRVNTYAESAIHPHTKSRDILQDTVLSDGSTIPITGPAAKFSRTPTKVRHGAPVLGQHNDEILGGLGYTEQDLKQLKEAGVI